MDMPDSKFNVGDRVVFDTRHWWYWLWLKPYYRFGDIKSKTYCFGWIYNVEGCEWWCSEGYLKNCYDKWFDVQMKRKETK